MKQIVEVIQDNEFYSMHRINEMATISNPEDKLPQSSKVCVYGEKDEQGTKEPHFHIIIDNGEIELEIYLKNAKQLNIWRTKRNYPKSWDGITNVKKAIIKWLSKENPDFPNMTNLQVIVSTWNLNNPNNKVRLDYAN